MAAKPVAGNIGIVTHSVREALAARITGARGAISADLFRAQEGPVTNQLVEAALQGRPLSLLVDPGLPPHALPRQRLLEAGATITPYGTEGVQWQHAKAYWLESAGGSPEAWVGNLTPVRLAEQRNELTTVLRGDAAAAVRELHLATAGTDATRARQAVDNAALAGVLVNDPVARAHTLTDSMIDVIRESRRSLRIATKGIDDPAATREIVAARQRGVDVQVVVRDLADADADLLEAAGVPTRVVHHATPTWRLNMVANEQQATIGSAYLWSPMTRPDRATSRDMGVLLAGDNARRVQAAVAQLAAAVDRPRDIAQARALGWIAPLT